MKILVIYDSTYGNTQKIAQSIGSAIKDDVQVLLPGETNDYALASVDLFIIGSPVNGGRPTKVMLDFISRLPESTVKGRTIAAFDTRLSSKWVGIFGYAAGKIADNLKKKGGSLVVPPEGFFVKGREGPLKEGELERAAIWAKSIIEAFKEHATAQIS